MRARAHWSGPATRHGRPPAADPPPAPASAGAAGGIEEGGATTPHAVFVRRAQSPRMQVVPEHRGVRHCCSRHHKGHPRLAPAVGGARQCTIFGMGGVCTPGGGGGATMRRWPRTGRARIRPPQGALGTRAGTMGRRRGKIPDLGAPVLPSHHNAKGWAGGGGGRLRQPLTHNPLA